MTAPKRIWADQDNLTWVENDPGEVLRAQETEYVRADIVQELAEALEVYADGCDATETTPCGYAGNMCCMTARAALAKLQEADQPRS